LVLNFEGEKRKNHADVATDVAKTGVVLVLWGKSNGFNNLGYRTSGFVVQRGNSDLTRVQG